MVTMASAGGNNLVRITLAGFLAWLVPGMGHLYLGHRRRGLILLVVIAITFWSGAAMGGISTTVDPQNRTAWFMAQVCTGAHALAALGCKSAMNGERAVYSWQAEEVAVVYCGVAGLLNLLVILDALARADAAVPAKARRRSTVRGQARVT